MLRMVPDVLSLMQEHRMLYLALQGKKQTGEG
jgi:hypothetical protein